MGRLEPQYWVSDIAGLGIPRRDRAGGRYHAYIPDPLAGRPFKLDGDVAADVADATSAIARLNAGASALTNTEALARLLLRAEAVASSHIEGLRVSPQRLLRADAARAEGAAISDETANEVLANVDAMAYAVHDVAGPVTVKRVLEVHRRLLVHTDKAKHAGVIRTEQNWIGGSDFNPLQAAFVPPPPQAVPHLLDDLAEFCNGDNLPAIAQAAIAHAQFETIHPFADGNGRTGRALIYMVLGRRGLTTRVAAPVSLALATRARDYVRGLDSTRYVGSPSSPQATEAINAWVGFFAAACTRAVADAESFERRVQELQIEWRARLGGVRSDSSAVVLLQHLPAMPLLTVRGAATVLGRTFRAVNRAVDELVDAEVLTPAKAGQRNRVFEARELIDAFTALERQLASPEGITRTSPPVRPVPARPRRNPKVAAQ
ncbi:MAG: Fic family protein [Candidatus Eremiobacteraeota bacterium]|nr:Fic family protein [Candidatus Eremiobacteraeota bacterium]